MKIGVLTYHAACNFGANLQVLSTVDYLKNNGHTPIVINWMTAQLEEVYKKNTPNNQFEEHSRYRDLYLPLSKRCFDDNDIVSVINEEKIEGLIIGSDAVMQHHPVLSRIQFPTSKIFSISKIGSDRMCPNPFWGSFYAKLEKKIPLCLMSASSQNSSYRLVSLKERTMLGNHLNQFDYISNRDDWSSKMVNYLTRGKITPPITPDPVFGFNYNVKEQPTEDYIRNKYKLKHKYFLFSFHNSQTVSFDWLMKMKEKASSEDIDCVALPFPQGVHFNHPFEKVIGLPLSPLEWYALLKYSSAYIGHNMHPIVVCLHNVVPCFSFDNYGEVRFKYFVNEKSSKIYHIMNHFGILDNRVSCVKNRINPVTVDFVLERLKGFDKVQVANIRDEYLEQYKEMMQNIISILSSK